MAASQVIRLVNFGLRLLQLLSSVIILGVFSYFLAVLGDHDHHAQDWLKAVTGISGVAAFYALLASFLTLSLGGFSFFSRITMVFDLCFAIGFLAICLMTRHGVQPCAGRVDTPIGSGNAQDPAVGYGEGGFGTGRGKNFTYMLSLGSACRLEKAAFTISVIGISLFLVSIPAQRAYTKHHQSSDTFSNAPPHKGTSTGIRSRFWPNRKYQEPTTDPARIEYCEGDSSSGVIPLEEKPKVERPQFTNMLQRFKNNSSANDDPESIGLQPNAQGSSNAPPGFNPSYEYGKIAYAVTSPNGPISPTSPDNTNPWVRSEYAEYNYGQSGIYTGGYAHGYGNISYK
ncbi:hypothetical protein McanMca71_007328 [Microsporum canis]